MQDNGSKGTTYTAGFFMLIAFTIAGAFFASVISFPLWKAMTGTNFSATDLSNPAYSNPAKILQAVTAIVGFLFPSLLTAYLLNKYPLRLMGFTGRIKTAQILLVILIMGVALLVSTGLSWVNANIPIPAEWKTISDRLEHEYNRQVIAIVGLKTPFEFILALVVMAFIPAFCEETLFRGGLQNYLTRATQKPWLSIIIVSLIFSAVHFSFYGFLSRFFLGCILGLLYHYSGRLWLSILAHFANNAAALTVLYIAKVNGTPLEKAIEESADTWAGLLALPVVAALVILYRRISSDTRLQSL